MERSVERRESAQEQFDAVGLDVEFFRASDGKLEAPEKIFISKSEWGCADSHIRIWKDIIENGYETALVFEDDVVLDPNFVSKLDEIMNELPPDWDFVNLGNDPNLSISFGKHTETVHIGKSLLTHAYLIRLKRARKWAGADAAHLKDGGIDSFISNYPSHNLFMTEPIARQKNTLGTTIGWSRTYDFSFMFQKFWFVPLIIFLIVLVYIYRKQIFG
jgi:hypothetical protein